VRRALFWFAAFCAVAWIVTNAAFRYPRHHALTSDERAALIARVRRGETIEKRGEIFVRRYGARIKVDVLLARGRLLQWPEPLFALGLVPGLDGVGVTVGDRDVYLLPDELMLADALASRQPLAALDFELGANKDRIDELLAKQLGLDDNAFARADKKYFRFRTDGFIESADRAAVLPVMRGNTPGPSPTKENLRAGAIAGGRYLLRHLYDDGRFGYEYTPSTDKDEAYGLDYSLPRHAGGAYFLAQIFGATRDDAFRAGSSRALDFLAARQPDACNKPERACVANRESRYADLGTTAMSLLAVVEYESATGDRALLPWARRLAGFLLYMQKPDGDFCHVFDPIVDRRDEKTKMLYFSGEAAFALAKLVALLGPGDADYARFVGALDRGLDYLTGAQYAFLAGQFYFGEDHWTCMAADAGWDALSPAHRERYADFCDAFAAFLRRTQFQAGEPVVAAQPDFLGAYGFSPFLPPHATPVGSRSETTISTYLMRQRRGRDAKSDDRNGGRETLEQIRLGMQFLLAHQIRDDDAYLMANADAARGGFLMSDVKRYIRIDFVQHSCSAMLRAIPLL
jgi:hypothetical protein